MSNLYETTEITTTTRLETIADRQRKSIVRDALFAAFVVLAAAIGVATVTGGGSPPHLANR